jgi:DNA-binding Lrp family transcriptional regulator
MDGSAPYKVTLANGLRRAERPAMAESVDASVNPVPADPWIWDVSRASLAYVRDTSLISRGDGDLLDPLLFTAILDANMVPVNRDPELRITYGGDVSAPDHLRRPVSINAVAQSLHLPFETVRRRVSGMAQRGQCVIDPRGVVVPHAAVTSPAYVAIQRARYDRARRFYQALKAAGALPSNGPADTLAPTARPLVRAANRALSAYMLRAANDLIALTGDALSSLILLELTLGNTEPVADCDLPAWASNPLGVARPVRIAALAKSLRFSSETTRRHLMGLEAAGFCRRTERGLVAVAPPTVWPELARLMAANLANVHRLFGTLRELQVLAAWDTPDAIWPAAVA